MVNPHDIDGMARQIAVALSMGLEERRERWRSMVGTLRASSVQNWFSEFLSTLADVRRPPTRLAASRAAVSPIMLDVARAQRH